MTLDPSQLNQQRKDDHVNLALEQQKEKLHSTFDDIRFVHHSFSKMAFEQVDVQTVWAQHTHQMPFYINGMTGGSKFTKQFNEKLGQVAAQTGLAIATGSVSAALKDPSLNDSFQIMREVNPNGFVMANLGAHHSLENAKRAVDLLKADALQIHLNVPQEIVMPEGDRDFSNWAENIQAMVENLGVPVIVKEVGFGMSRETIELLISLGVANIDVSGRGGTNFVRIEDDRNNRLDFSALGEWGQTTAESLVEAHAVQDLIERNQVTLLASGGIRQPFDILKALSLGAFAVGLSGRFLASVNDIGVDGTVEMVHNWRESLQLMMLMLEAKNIQSLQHKDLILSGNLLEWAQLRQIDADHFANRSQFH